MGIVAVTHDDVRAIAALARLEVPAARLDTIVTELNGILSHMAVLARVEGRDAAERTDAAAVGMKLAPDHGPSVALERAPEAFAPSWRDGFFLVPRLATHDRAGATGADES
jgi:aspartyl-tRNA(Asn)/glutamyl-tRNA(Gln) amidotransferase subunit C